MEDQSIRDLTDDQLIERKNMLSTWECSRSAALLLNEFSRRLGESAPDEAQVMNSLEADLCIHPTAIVIQSIARALEASKVGPRLAAKALYRICNDPGIPGINSHSTVTHCGSPTHITGVYLDSITPTEFRVQVTFRCTSCPKHWEVFSEYELYN